MTKGIQPLYNRLENRNGLMSNVTRLNFHNTRDKTVTQNKSKAYLTDRQTYS